MIKSLLVLLGIAVGAQCLTLPIRWPQVKPLANDAYFCLATSVSELTNSTEAQYLTSVTSNVQLDSSIHHFLVYGCKEPGVPGDGVIFNCAHMTHNHHAEHAHHTHEKHSVCKDNEEQVLYAWGKKNERFEMPPNVGIKIGGDTGINYFVVELHYGNLKGNEDPSLSEVSVTLEPESRTTVTKRAAMLILESRGTLPAKKVETMDITYEMKESLALHPFAFAVHTHALGTMVSGYRLRGSARGGQGRLELIGERSPQEMQIFYPTTENMVIEKGDLIMARCTFNNTLDRAVSYGQMRSDEMCNWFMLYYVQGDHTLSNNQEISVGPPQYYWRKDVRVQKRLLPKL